MSGILAVLAGSSAAAGGGGGGGGFSVIADPAILTAIGNQTDTATATPTGGSSPYTYQWSLIGGSNIGIGTPNVDTTTFFYSGGPIMEATATFQCAVQDSNGVIAYSNQVDVTVYTSGGS